MLNLLKRRRRRKLTREEYRQRVKFTDDFFFSRVMQNLDLCKRMVEALLGIKVKSVRVHQTQRQLKREKHTHGIRLDVCLEDDDRVIVVEMQTANKKGFFWRIRLYQGLLDTAMLPAGASYKSLKNTYIIFLCTFDPVGLGLPIYTVRQCYEEDLYKKYDDGTCKILYNAAAWASYEDAEIQAILKYMDTGQAQSGLTEDIETGIETERDTQRLRSEYMTYDMKLCEVRDETWEEASHERAVDDARAFLQMGLSPQQVAQGTGLPIDEVRTLL